MLKHKIKKEEGSGLVLTLMVLLVLSVLGASVATVTVGSNRLGHATQDSNSAYYIAEAGANMAYEEIASQINKVYADNNDPEAFFRAIPTLSSSSYSSFETQLGDKPEATITVETIDTTGDKRQFMIRSVGEVGGKIRIVEKPVKVAWVGKGGGSFSLFPTGAALNVLDTLKLPESSIAPNDKVTVKEGLLYSSSLNPKIPDKSMFKNDDIKITQGDHIWEINLKNLKEQYPAVFETYLLEKTSLLSLDEIGEIPDQNASEYTGDIIFDTKDIKIKNNIVINGNIIAKKGSVTLGTDTTVNGSIILGKGDFFAGDRLKVTGDIVTREGKIDINTNSEINRSLISNEGKISTKNHLTVNGDILSGKNKIELGTDTIINGSVISNEITTENKLTVNGAIISFEDKIEIPIDSKVTGVVVGNDVKLGQRVEIIYSDNYKDSFPFNKFSENNSDLDADDLISSKPAIEK